MTEEELLSSLESEEHSALGFFYGDLSREREKALRYYQGEIDLPTIEGRSDIVSTDVRDAVDGMLPDLLDIFLSSDEVVQFDPTGPEDEDMAQQATDACNYIFYKQNNGALILYEWFKTALLEKNGIVKFWWETSEQVTTETYQGLSQIELTKLTMDKRVEIVQAQSYPDPTFPSAPNPMMQAMPGMQPPQVPILYDVTCKVKQESGKICIKGVPPEEFLICSDHDSLCIYEARFVGHRCKKTASEIKALGLIKDLDELEGVGSIDNENVEFSGEWSARRRHSEEQFPERPETNDPASKTYWVLEAYYRVDFDGDGYTELRKIFKIGNKILLNEESEYVPFAAICPVIMPYRFYGLSVSDLVTDIQYLKTQIWRQMMDSLYLATNPRVGVMESMVNLDDLLVSRPGGIIRTKSMPSQVIQPVETRFVGQQAFPMVEYSDAVKENRTGFTRYNQGLDANSLNKTATGVSLITQSAAKRLKLIARMFAQTGMKDLFKGMLHLMAKYNSKPMILRLRNQYVPIDPRQWNTGWDVSINIGLGTGDHMQEVQKLMAIWEMQKTFKAAGMSNVVTDKNLYRTAYRVAEKSGFKNKGEFFTDPQNAPPPPPPPPPPEIIKIQTDAQTDQAKIQSQERQKMAEMQNSQAIANIQSQATITVAEIKALNERVLKNAEIQSKEAVTLFGANHDEKMAKMNGDGEDKSGPTNIIDSSAVAPFEKQAQATQDMMQQVSSALAALSQSVAMLAAPKKRTPIRDKEGNILSVEESTIQ